MPGTSTWRNWFITHASSLRSRSGSRRAPVKSNVISSRESSMWGKLARRVAADPCVHLPTPAEGVPSRTMRRLHEEIREIRVPSEVLARWALETPVAAQEATGAALAFLVHAEHAAATLLPVPTLLRSEQAILDPDGFLRQPRGAVEHFRLRAQRAIAWLDMIIFFRIRIPSLALMHTHDAIHQLGLTSRIYYDV